MVRKLRSCVQCKGRFVSVSGTSEHCKKCRTGKSVPIPSFGDDREQTDVIKQRSIVSRVTREETPKRGGGECSSGDPISVSIATVKPTTVSPVQDPAAADPTGIATTLGTSTMRDTTENDAAVDHSVNIPSPARDNQSVVAAEPGIIEILDEEGSACSAADSDISENLTLAQVATVALSNQEETVSCNQVVTLSSSAELDIPEVFESDHGTTWASEEHLDLKPTGIVAADQIQRQTPTDLASATSCFICGCSFDRISTGYKGRLNHIKRCSKKHGVTASDVKVNDDEEHFQAPSPAGKKDANNPYARQNDSWHDGADQDLKLAGKQTTMTTFFSAPAKSLNNVLMAGAKRVAKSGDLLLAAAKKKQKSAATGNKRSFGRNYSNSPCPYYKKIPGTDFVCDGFMYARSALTKNYFLTHFHSDHYGGINKSWNAGTIYCSLGTANLVAQQLGVDKKYLHPLGMNSPVVIESQGKPVTVTLLDANHCPGAVMFLFRVGRRHILHVGDFRWNRERMYPDLKDFITLKIRLDDLFLDTTYCNEKYRLPTQDEAIRAGVEMATQEIEQSRKAKKRLLMLFGAYTIGKERIYLAVAEKLGMKVFVEKTRYRILSALGWPPEKMKMFTTERSSTCLWVVPLGHINFKKLAMYVDGSTKVFSSRSYDKVVGFRPTGWSLTGCNNGILSTRSSGIFTVHGVPYSEHSSFPELVDCLDCLKPKRIIPTVSVSKSDEQVALLLKELKKKNFSV